MGFPTLKASVNQETRRKDVVVKIRGWGDGNCGVWRRIISGEMYQWEGNGEGSKIMVAV